MKTWLALLLTLLLTPAYAQSTFAQSPQQYAQAVSTNPPEIQKWFASLENRIGGGCCGEGDAYPAVIDVEATPEHNGRGHITDPSAKTVVVNGVSIKQRHALSGDLTFEFSYNKMTKEKDGNPFDYAIAFVRTGYGQQADGSYQLQQTDPVYCIVVLPKYY